MARLRILATMLVCLLCGTPWAWPQTIDQSASAQTRDTREVPDTSSDPPAQQGGESPRRLNATWQDGFILQSDDAAYRLRVGALVRSEGRFAHDDPAYAITDTFVLRSGRMVIQARLAKYFQFALSPEFAGSGSALQDAYIDIQLSPAFDVRVGRAKTPLGLELLQMDANVIFLSYGPPTQLLPSRDVGVQFYGDLAHGVISYGGGIFNGIVDGTSSSNNIDSNGSKDAVGRILVRPFVAHPASVLGGLTVGVAGSAGRQQGALPSFRTSTQQTYFSYASGVAADGMRTRVAPQMMYSHKNFGAFSEYVRSQQAVVDGDVHQDIANQAWQVAGYLTVTGETVTERLRPAHPFDPDKHTWGALQLTTRYGALTVDPRAGGMVGSNASRQIRMFTLGANWFLTTQVKVLVNFEHTRFSVGAQHVENALLTRLQLSF